MPGTTRYSATFDRPYEEEEDEEDLPAVPPLTRRSRSASWQATTANGRPYTPLGGYRGSHARSSSTDNGATSLTSSPAGSTERIPTRTTGKVSVKNSHHNPFQFVKIGSSPLYKKAEDQLKKTQLVKQPEVLKEEEEEWQTNLDSWKSRRRKMSQDVFQRQEEMKLLEEKIEEQSSEKQKKIKTFSEMVEERASRGRTLSLCLFSNPLDMDDWNNKIGRKNGSKTNGSDTHQSSGSAESSNVNSEDDNEVFQNAQGERNGAKNVNNSHRTRRTGAVQFTGNHNGVNNGISSSSAEVNGNNCDFKGSEIGLNGEVISPNCEPCQSGAYNDSGLDSLSSSHRAGDIPDSGSDFSQDSGSSLDCDSPGITGVPTLGTELLEEFSSKEAQQSNGIVSPKEKINGMELCLKFTLTDSKIQQYGFTVNGGKDKGSPVTVASVINGSISDLVGLKTGDQILAINKEDITSLSHSAVISSLKHSTERKQLQLLLWRPGSSNIKSEKLTVNGSSSLSSSSESPSKKPANEQACSKELNKSTNGKSTKASNVSECVEETKMDIGDPQINKKTGPTKQKDLNSKSPTPEKSRTQDSIGNIVKSTKNDDALTSATEDQHVKSVESENEMYVDDFDCPPITNNSKIPVAEKSPPKIMGQKGTKVSPDIKKNKTLNEANKKDESSIKTTENSVEDSQDSSKNATRRSPPLAAKRESKTKDQVSSDPKLPGSSSVVNKKADGDHLKSPEVTPKPNKQHSMPNEKPTFETNEILPVDQVAEKMERLILEQLEEEERLKEKPLVPVSSMHNRGTTPSALQEHEKSGIDHPPRQAKPPKEKPPPPPPPPSLTSTSQDPSLNRVNSTKRIKKEIQKRRIDFLGIEKSEEVESAIPPPPDLQNILKLECEQERKVREILGKEALQQRELSLEEDEIARREREIIENLETEERIRMAEQAEIDESLSSSLNDAAFAEVEAERIKQLQVERVRMEEERFLKEEQRIRLEEERQLREREDQIRREEEVIRKERERLRQEQEALQREREQYRRQMLKEQELLQEPPKPHAPDAPASHVGVPPPLKPALPPLPLTPLPHAPQAMKENIIYTSRSHSANPASTAAGNHNTVVTSPSVPFSNPIHNTAARPKLTQNEAWVQQKVPVVKKQPDLSSESRYNQNHWLIQEAEMRRISEQKERQRVHPYGDPRCAPLSYSQGQYHPMHTVEDNYCSGAPSPMQKPPVVPGPPSLLNKPSNYSISTQMHLPEQQWNYGQPMHPTPQNRKFPIHTVTNPVTDKIQPPTAFPRNARIEQPMIAPTKPSRVVPMDRQEQMLSVSGRKRCSHCGEELGRGAAMIIESLQLYYHIQCFRCCVCQAQLGNGSCGTDVRVRNNKLHCHNCYSNDEAGLKFSQV